MQYTFHMDVYAENILEHYRHPRGKESLTSSIPSHTEANISCGDTLTIQLVSADGALKKINWQGTGCAISQAAMSMLAEELEGKTLEDVEAVSKEDVYELLGVPIGTRRVKCALLSLHTLKNTLRKLYGKDPQSWLDTVEITDE